MNFEFLVFNYLLDTDHHGFTQILFFPSPKAIQLIILIRVHLPAHALRGRLARARRAGLCSSACPMKSLLPLFHRGVPILFFVCVCPWLIYSSLTIPVNHHLECSTSIGSYQFFRSIISGDCF